MKRASLRQVSAKRRALLRERKKLTDAMKREGPVMCQFYEAVGRALAEISSMPGCGYADDLHEIVSRARGGSIVDPENVVPLCREHHRWVTEHPLEAEKLGLSRRKQ